MKYFYLNFEKDRKTLKLAEENASAVEKELSPAGYFAIVSSENMTHGKQLSYIKADMHQKNCSAVTNLILEIKACEYIVMKHCH